MSDAFLLPRERGRDIGREGSASGAAQVQGRSCYRAGVASGRSNPKFTRALSLFAPVSVIIERVWAESEFQETRLDALILYNDLRNCMG